MSALSTLPTATIEEIHGRPLIAAIDLESTGSYIQGPPHGRDRVFAAGIAVGVVLADGRLAVVRDLCSSYIDVLPHVTGENWASCWRTNGWEQRCYDEFWSREENTRVLEQLQRRAVPTDVAARVRHEFHRVEAVAHVNGCPISWYTDCPMFDPWWVNLVMLNAGERPLVYYRNNAYGLDVIDLFSKFTGVVAALTGEPTYTSTPISKAARAEMRARAARDCPHTHDPIDDATYIVAEVFHLPAAVRDVYAAGAK